MGPAGQPSSFPSSYSWRRSACVTLCHPRSPFVPSSPGPRQPPGAGGSQPFSFIYQPITSSGAMTGLIFALQHSLGHFFEISMGR